MEAETTKRVDKLALTGGLVFRLIPEAAAAVSPCRGLLRCRPARAAKNTHPVSTTRQSLQRAADPEPDRGSKATMTPAKSLAHALLNNRLIKQSPRRHYVAVEREFLQTDSKKSLHRFPIADLPDLSD